MREYLRLVDKNKLDTVNKLIGKRIKERYGLTNDVGRNECPESTLISSHQEFE